MIHTVEPCTMGHTMADALSGKVLTLEDFLQDDAEYEEVLVGKKTIRIRTLTSEDLIQFRELSEAERKTGTLRLIQRSIVDADGKRVFDDSDEHFKLVKQRPEKHNIALLKAITRLNGMTPEAQEQVKND